MSYSMMVFPFALASDEYESNVKWLGEVGVGAPEPAHELPTPAHLRDAMISQGCLDPFWPDASCWFYSDSRSAFESDPATVEDEPVWIGGVGDVDIQVGRGTTVGAREWAGDWLEPLGMFSFDRPDVGAAPLVVREMARRHGPHIVFDDVSAEPVVVEAKTPLRDVYENFMEAEE